MMQHRRQRHAADRRRPGLARRRSFCYSVQWIRCAPRASLPTRLICGASTSTLALPPFAAPQLPRAGVVPGGWARMHLLCHPWTRATRRFPTRASRCAFSDVSSDALEEASTTGSFPRTSTASLPFLARIRPPSRADHACLRSCLSPIMLVSDRAYLRSCLSPIVLVSRRCIVGFLRRRR